jgi:uncharacterized iron-regulated membrane protein
MTIGGSIALLILGAILAFAVSFEIAGIDIQVIGIILMLGGIVGLIFGLVYWQRRRVVERPPVAERPVERTRVVDDRDVY